MNKILIDFRHIAGRNGFSSVLKMILNSIKTDNSRNYFLLINENTDLSDEIKDNPNIQTLYAKSKPFSFMQNIEIPLIMLKNKIKILHAVNFDIPFFIFCVPKYKLISVIHDLIPIKYTDINKQSLIKKIYFNFMFRLCGFLSQTIITVSEYSKKDIVEFLKIKKDKVIVIHNSFEPKINNNEQKTQNDIPTLFFAGNNFAYKNIGVVVDAVKILKDENIRVNFNIAGRPTEYTQYIKQKVKEYNLEEQVKIFGMVSDEKLKELYNTADIYVFPSLLEGFGIPLLEAMSVGIPVISSNKTCLPEIAGDAAILIDPTPENYAREIKNLIENKAKAQELVANGYERIKNFSQKVYNEKLMETYSLLNL